MLALWLQDQKMSLRDDLPVPEPAAGEVLVRVRLAGICGTDLQLCRGYYPFTGIPGHEFVGEIAGPHARAGERVVGSINLGCGTCGFCRRGLPNHCERRAVLGIKNRSGAFAEYLVLPEANLHPVPDGVSDAQAVFTEPLAAALEILEQVRPAPSQRVLVIGAGKLGQLVARVLRLSGADLVVSARYPAQRALLEQAGIAWCAQPEARAWNLVIEASGSPGGLQQALTCVKPRGCVVLKSTFGVPVELPLAQVVVDEIRLQGSRCGPFPPALRLLADGLVDPRPLIGEVFPLQKALTAFEHAAQPGAGKLLLAPGRRDGQDSRLTRTLLASSFIDSQVDRRRFGDGRLRWITGRPSRRPG